MTDTSPASTSTATPVNVNAIGFLTVMNDGSGALGGYLVTNTWGRPLEFRLSSAVQPNRVQQILYGPTLTEYLHADLIGKTLVEKTSTLPGLIITDSLPALALHDRLRIPTLALGPIPGGASDLVEFRHSRATAPLVMLAKLVGERPLIDERLERVDPAVDLAEPFARIREAITEARKMGVANRAA